MKTAVICNSCGAGWDSDKERCSCGRDLHPMKNTLITVSDEANLDMFRKVNNENHNQQ